MRLMSSIAGCALALSLAACGSKSDKPADQGQQAPKPEVSGAQAPTAAAAIPDAMVLRVPVDADGNATGMPEMKVVKKGEVADSSDAVVSAFDKGDAATVGELDADSSTQSWSAYGGYSSSYGNNYNSSYGQGGQYGGQQSYGQQSYGCGSSCGGYNQSYFSNSYRPSLSYGGQSYNYGYYRPYSYVSSGYSYYCYRPYRGSYGGGYGGGGYNSGGYNSYNSDY